MAFTNKATLQPQALEIQAVEGSRSTKNSRSDDGSTALCTSNNIAIPRVPGWFAVAIRRSIPYIWGSHCHIDNQQNKPGIPTLINQDGAYLFSFQTSSGVLLERCGNRDGGVRPFSLYPSHATGGSPS